MSPVEAIQLLEQATAHLTSNRETHIKIMEACKIIRDALVESAVMQKISEQAVTDSGHG